MEIESSNLQYSNVDSSEIVYGSKKIHFRIIRSKRRTLEIAVLPDKSVEVKAPYKSSPDIIDTKVKKHARWILRQRAFFRQFDPRTPAKQYLGGETHLYLGKKYRLKVQEADISNVKLSHGFINVSCAGSIAPEMVRLLLTKWYREKACAFFNEVFTTMIEKLSISTEIVPTIKVRKMTSRWGSLSKNGILTMNAELIKVPRECIEYVIIHELCHLRFHDHSKGFYCLLESWLPDWKKRKQRLEEVLV